MSITYKYNERYSDKELTEQPRNEDMLIANTTRTGISDERLNEDIEVFHIGELANFVSKLNVVKYKSIGDKTPRIGLIAQQVMASDYKLAPLFIDMDDSKDHYLSLKAEELVFPLIAAVQYLANRVEDLENREKQSKT